MKNDSSRFTFDPRKHFRAVLMQQGRVQLDADWNEQGEIFAHRVETEAADIIGLCGGPLHCPAFHIVATINQLTAEEKKVAGNVPLATAITAPNFLISAGRYYVDGILCENERLVSYLSQPDFPKAPALNEPGLYLIYVDVWERLLTALDDPSIREVALGGPDTATRKKNIWQIKYLHLGAVEGNCLTKFQQFEEVIAPSSGRLSARTEPGPPSTNPCIIPPGAGYRGLENQLYRVEIHEGGRALNAKNEALTTAARVPGTTDQVTSTGVWKVGQAVEVLSSGSEVDTGTLAYITNTTTGGGSTRLTLNLDLASITPGILLLRPAKATYKWSRDNGVTVTTIESVNSQNQKEITVHDVGPDAVLGFNVGQWVEIVDDVLELKGQPGQLARIVKIDPAINLITLNVDASLPNGFDHNPKLRGWHGVGAVKFHPDFPDRFLDLENGVQVRFFDGTFKTGDYWTVAARTANADAQSGNIEWPQDQSNNQPLAQLAFGIKHHYCRLAMLRVVPRISINTLDNAQAAQAASDKVGGDLVGIGFPTGLSFSIIDDCRNLFPPVTELTSLFYLSGDGQEAMPDLTLNNPPLVPLAQPLIVGVAMGSWPVPNAKVRFRVTKGNGRIFPFGTTAQPASSGNEQADFAEVDGYCSTIGGTFQMVHDGEMAIDEAMTRCRVLVSQIIAVAARHPNNADFNTIKALCESMGSEPNREVVRQAKEISQAHAELPGGTVGHTDVNPDLTGRVLGSDATQDGLQVGSITIDVRTDQDGLARCHWHIDPFTQSQQARATLLDADDKPVHLPVTFTANVSDAAHVAYAPGACTSLEGQKTVQMALSRLAELISLYQISGDGQHVMPGEHLAPLVVQVSSRCGPIKDQEVTFRAIPISSAVAIFAGTVSHDDQTFANLVKIKTDVNGLASCFWRPDPSIPFQEVEATITSPLQKEIPPVRVRFHAIVNQPQCEVTVGEGGQFRRLDGADGAIEQLRLKKKTDICICLLPGNHILEAGLTIAHAAAVPPITFPGIGAPNAPLENPVRHVKITGCGPGSRILLSSNLPLKATGLESFVLRDVEVSATSFIDISQCKDVMFAGCRLTKTNDFVPIITVAAAQRIRFERNFVEALVSISGSAPGQPTNPVGVVAGTVLAPLAETTDQVQFDKKASEIATDLAGLSAAKRKSLAKKLQKSLRAVDNLTQEQVTSFNDLTENLAGKTVDASQLQGNLAGIVLQFRDPLGVAIVIKDASADTWIENNDITGVVSLYGEHGASLEIAELKRIAEGWARNALSLLFGRQASLHVRDNVISRMTVSDETLELLRLLNPSQTGSTNLDTLYGKAFITNNVFRRGSNDFVMEHLVLTSNSFPGAAGSPDAGAVVGDAGAVVADAAIYVGNYAPLRVVPPNTPKIPPVKLFDVARTSEQVANLTIDIANPLQPVEKGAPIA